jgi:SAM-dependent methyltransferase
VEGGSRVLEVGCGSGNVTRALQGAGYLMTAVDTSVELARSAEERCPTASIVVGDVADLPPAHRGPYDAVGFFDVLEHVDPPEQLLRSGLKWLRAGGLVFVTVPALSSLFSAFDAIQGHKRRYDVGDARQLLEAAGLSEAREHGLFRATLPLVRWKRSKLEDPTGLDPGDAESMMVESLAVPPWPVNLALTLMCRVERSLGWRLSRTRSGSSIIAVARKR